MKNKRLRIYMTGVGGQGTLTATTLLARVALDCGLEVVAGEVHGMAQRGGVVESAVLLGGWMSPKIEPGQADVLLGFEPLETLRALPYLAPGGTIFSSLDPMPPVGVALGREIYPPLDDIKRATEEAAGKCWFMHCRAIGQEAGSLQSGNSALLGALFASRLLPFGLEYLEAGITSYLPGKIVEANIKAARLGAGVVTGQTR